MTSEAQGNRRAAASIELAIEELQDRIAGLEAEVAGSRNGSSALLRRLKEHFQREYLKDD